MCTFGDRSGFVGRPTWEALRAGARAPLPPEGAEPGEWQHGWQHHASSSSKLHFRDAVVFVQSCPANQAHLRSHSGRASSAALHGVPSWLEFKLAPDVLRTLVLERMRLLFQVSEAQCQCGLLLGRHRAACPNSGRLKSRAQAPERTLAKVCRETGATVRFNVMFRDTNKAVSAMDHQAIDMLTSGLLLHHGVQLAVDITTRCAHTADSRAYADAATTNGAVLQAVRRKRRSTPNSCTGNVAAWLWASRLVDDGATRQYSHQQWCAFLVWQRRCQRAVAFTGLVARRHSRV